MSVLVVGISHNSAPVALLEKVALGEDGVQKLLHDASTCDHVTEAAVISTCNRVEIYAEVDRFHGSIEGLSGLLLERAGEPTETMLAHLYVKYDDGAVAHLFQVAAGLDSMALGEGQILGQARAALRLGQELGTVGPALNALFQQALRVGKRSRAETAIDTVAPSLVSAALAESSDLEGRETVAGRDVVVLGAGAMAGLATATAVRRDAAHVTVLNRSLERAERLAAEYGARAGRLEDLAAEVAAADLLVSCTGATGAVVTRAVVEEAMAARPGRPLTVVDVALPRDVEEGVADVPGVTVVGLEQLSASLEGTEAGGRISAEVSEVRRIVAEEVTSFVAARRQASVTPTVVALRSMATSVVDAEMVRLEARLPDLDADARAEILHTVRRVADKLLHEPTVRVKELSVEQGAVSYAAALAELFALDPTAVTAVTAVTRPTVVEEGTS